VDSSGSGERPVVGCCEQGNNFPVSIKYGEFHDYRCPVLLGVVELVINQFLVNYCFIFVSAQVNMSALHSVLAIQVPVHSASCLTPRLRLWLMCQSLH